MSFAACGETNDMELAPTRCISASLLPRDYSACRFLGSFSQKLPRRFTRQSKSEKGLRVLVRHGDKLRHDAFNKAAPRTKAVVALLAFFYGKPAVKHLASVLILPDFLLRAFQLGITFLDGLRRFLLRRWWSLLSARRHKKGRLLRFGNSRPMGQIFSLWGVVCLVVAIGRNHAQD